MTCIIGLIENDEVYIGGDSAAVGGRDIRKVAQPKVFRVSDFLIGCTTSFRMMQLLQHRLNVTPQGKQPDFAYMVTSFAEATRKLLKSYGFAKVEGNRERGGTFLVGYHQSLYQVQSDFSVLEYADGYDAVGCGSQYALGAMRVTHGAPKERIEMALRAAAYFSNGVTGPFKILRLNGDGDG